MGLEPSRVGHSGMFGMSLGFLGLQDGMDSGPSVVGCSGHVWCTSLGFPGQRDGIDSGIGSLFSGTLEICIGMSRIPWTRCEGPYISYIVWDCIGTILL